MTQKEKNNQNPVDSVQDTSQSQFAKSNGAKKSHQVENDNSRSDIIDKNQNSKPRDNA